MKGMTGMAIGFCAAAAIAAACLGLPDRLSSDARSNKQAGETSGSVPEETPKIQSTIIHSGLLNFDLVIHTKPFEWSNRAGKIALMDEGVLITKDLGGALTLYDFKTEQFRVLPFVLPASNHAEQPIQKDWPQQVEPDRGGRYSDVHVYRRDGEHHLLVSYTQYSAQQNCMTKRIAHTGLPDNWLTAGKVDVRWTDRFVSSPCVPVSEPDRRFIGNGDGGVVIADGADHVVFTIGDFGQDGRSEQTPRLAQSPDSTLGRIFRMSLSDFSVEMLSMGHRNPQGLAFDGAGRLWEVEHGPMGGDELNLIEKGANYGWPLVTYGVDYTYPANDAKAWPLNPDTGRHRGFHKPAFHWIPSIATHALVYLDTFHERWNGDLLVGTLAAQSIVRVRLDGDRVLGAEKIPIGQRVRDIAVSGNRIYMLFDENGFGILTPRDTGTGRVGD